MNLNHDNTSSSSVATETTTAIGTWQLCKAGFGLGAGWAAAEMAVGAVGAAVAAATAGVAGLGAAAVAGCFGGKEAKKEEPKK